MFQIQSKSSLKTALLLGAATASAMSLSTVARAQESSVETVVVTGSRIPQVGLYSSSPVTAVSNQEIKYEGTTNVETLLNNLPGVFADFTDTASNGASGTATVNLRNLGSARTLVLVDGTRMTPGDPRLPVADLNQIPAALVDHVEVQTGGASAVYGSDALGGVVNFIMRHDFEGVEVDGQYTVNNASNGNAYYDHLNQIAGFTPAPKDWWGGATTEGTLIVGTNTADGKGNITAYIGYRNTQAVLEANRDFSACSISSVSGGTLHRCAGSSNYNRWFSIDDAYAYYGSANWGVPIPSYYDFFQRGTGQQGSGYFVPYTGASSMKFNYGALNYLQRPDTRYTGGFFAHYTINPSVEVYSDFMFSDDHTLAQIAPSGAFLGTGVFGGLNQVNCDNPLMTAQEAATLCGYDAIDVALGTDPNGPPTCVPNGATGNCNLIPGQALLEIGRRDVEGGNRVDDLRHTSYRMKMGLRGDIGHGWSYDVYGQYGTTIFTENYRNEWSVSRVQNALQVNPDGNCKVADLGIDPTCVPLDIFDGIGSVTPAMLNYIGGQGFQEGTTEERIVSGALTGDLGEWGIQSPWAKSPVALALGAEYRSESLALNVSRDFSTGDLYGQGGPTSAFPKAGFDVEEGFGEIRVPLIQDMEFAKDLSLNGGYRYSSYSSAGTANSYKYGAEWQPIDDIRFRVSNQHAVRAPNALELFSPQSPGLAGGQDPCGTAANNDAGVLATCQALGVPNAGAGSLDCPASQCGALFGGNTALVPESSNTWTIGAVLTPTFIDGFTATIDYFQISVNKYIGVIPFQNILNGCYGDPNAHVESTPESQAFFCPFVHRNAQHQVWGSGFASEQSQNTAFLSTKGVDFEANYTTSMEDWGMSDLGGLAFNFVGTYLDQYDFQGDPLSAVDHCAGMYGTVCGTPVPKWRHKLRVTWTTPWDVDFSINWRHMAGVNFDTIGDPIDAHIPAFDWFDVAANWTVHTGIEFRVGVNNVFDKSPPVVDSNNFPAAGPPFGNGNTYPGVYDSLGRTIFIGVTAKY